jgi:hypothetical protein
MGLVAVFCWLATFLVGLTINSKPYRDALTEGNLDLLNLWMTMFTYTVTNAALLCVLSGVIGAIAYTLISPTRQQETADGEVLRHSLSDTPGGAVVAGVLRSFVIFLVFISGVYIGASDAFSATTQEQYARVVATTCLLSFFVSFNPKYFSLVVNWFAPPEEVGR